MKITFLSLIFFCSLTLKAQTDKTYHYLAGVATTCLAGGTFYHFTNKPVLSCAVGFGAACLAGAAKEWIWDKKMEKGDYDKKDFYATMWGGAQAMLFLRVGINLNEKKIRLMKDRMKKFQQVEPLNQEAPITTATIDPAIK